MLGQINISHSKENVVDQKCSKVEMLWLWEKWHLAHDCLQQKKVFVTPTFTLTYVCSYALVANSILGWILDTKANKHVVWDKSNFVDYYKRSKGHISSSLEMARLRKLLVLGRTKSGLVLVENYLSKMYFISLGYNVIYYRSSLY